MTSRPERLRDPVTFEVFKNALQSLADEMGLVMVRTAHSSNANRSRDFSTALCDASGRVIAQGNTILLHLGAVSGAVTQLVSKFQSQIDPDDVFIFNETEEVSTHLPDIFMIRPCFVDRDLVGFAVCVSHHVDVGGRVAGGRAPDSKEIFEEGLQIPLSKLVVRGAVNETLKAVILANVRLPDLMWGDFEGQMAACYVGERGIRHLAHRHGVAVLRELSAELLDYTERLTRLEIAAIPDGDYAFEDTIDDDGAGNGPVRLAVIVRVRGDDIEVDWSDSAAQVSSAINCPITNTRSATYGALQGAFSDQIPSNDGFYRAINVIAPPGSIANPRRPAAHTSRGITTARMIDTVLGALSSALPDRVPAAGDGGMHIAQIAALDAEGRRVVAFANSGVESWGGRPGSDGIEGVSPFQANMSAYSIEDQEASHVLRIERRAFRPDSGGAGQWRGGVGQVCDLRFLADDGYVICRYGRREFPPYGLAGGRRSTPTLFYLNPGTPEERLLSLFGVVPLKRGDLIRVMNPGGGGYGDPYLREPAAVLDDVLDEKLTVEYAHREYGVVVDLASARIISIERPA